jgi:ElaB/YqjD/DUF883 family membrane-anchored ribosome-binding protein
MGQSAEELRREIEDTRWNMSRDLDAIGDRVSPRRMAERRVARTRTWLSGARDKVFGSADHAVARVGTGMHDVSDSMGERAHAMAETVGHAPQMATSKTQGNPMAAGAVAFGVGFLASMVLAPTEVEQEAVGRLADKAQPVLEPLKEQVSHAAHEVAEGVKGQGHQVVGELRDDAKERASTVQETARDAASDARQQTRP